MEKIVNRTKSRVVKHRARVTASGAKRVEVTVPSIDAVLVKSLAGVLRSGGRNARLIRQTLQPFISTAKAQTGVELVEFLRKSPLVDADLQIGRDSSVGRTADLQ